MGLPKEQKTATSLKYGIAENCLLINPPKLNPEIEAFLPEAVTSRDDTLVSKQEKVVTCVAALSTILTKLLNGEVVDRLTVLITLSDAGKLLVDLQRDKTLTRHALVLANLNWATQDTLNATTVDERLFGKQLDENIKTARSLERSTKVLLRNLKSVAKVAAKQAPKNYKSPLRHQNYKARQSTRGRQMKNYHQRSSGYRKPDSKQENYSRKKHQEFL